jgi:hypothetical protein
MTDTDHTAAAKKHADETRKKLKEERDAREKASKEREKAAGEIKPTPTQEENDLAASGVPVTEHEDDGSGPDPNVPATRPGPRRPKHDRPRVSQPRRGPDHRESRRRLPTRPVLPAGHRRLAPRRRTG